MKTAVRVVWVVGALVVAVGLAWLAQPRHQSDELWFTTVSCPPGIESPCLDSTVSLSEFTAWLEGQR